MAKDREERYQTVKDFLLDLRKLKRQIEFETENERFRQPVVVSEATARRDTREGMETLNEPAARPTSSAKHIVTQIKQHRTGLL
ncbi:MAG: hypothetical protein ABR566_18205, partial [Pyrinomonadaceae bacterium]